MPTEKQAAEMWCPFVRHSDLQSDAGGSWNRGPAADNRVNLDPDGEGEWACNCIGSRCMAWRWRESASSPNRIGCCGLAGAGYLA